MNQSLRILWTIERVNIKQDLNAFAWLFLGEDHRLKAKILMSFQKTRLI